MFVAQKLLVEKYESKAAAGRQFPLQYNRRGFAKEGSAVRFNAQGEPVCLPINRIWGGSGFPLSTAVTARLVELQEKLAAALPARSYYFNPPEKTHITLFSIPFPVDRLASGLPQFAVPEEAIPFFQAYLRRFSPLQLFAGRAILVNDGWIMAGFLPSGLTSEDQPSAIDLMRQGLKLQRPDIIHCTVAGLLRDIDQQEHQRLLSILDEFNQQPLPPMEFRTVKVFHETLYYLSEIRLMGEVSLAGELQQGV